MGYTGSVQVIQRSNGNRQYYLICPAPLAQALELVKSEEIEWIIENKNTIILRRAMRKSREKKRQ